MRPATASFTCTCRRGTRHPAGPAQEGFERFYRVEGTETEGSGLGLAIVAEIVQALGGRVGIADREGGRGIIVQVALPDGGRLSAPHVRRQAQAWPSCTGCGRQRARRFSIRVITHSAVSTTTTMMTMAAYISAVSCTPRAVWMMKPMP